MICFDQGHVCGNDTHNIQAETLKVIINVSQLFHFACIVTPQEHVQDGDSSFSQVPRMSKIINRPSVDPQLEAELQPTCSPHIM